MNKIIKKIWSLVLFSKTSFDTHYFELYRIITFCPLLYGPALFSRRLYFGQGFDANSHLSVIKYFKAGGDVRYYVLYRALCDIPCDTVRPAPLPQTMAGVR